MYTKDSAFSRVLKLQEALYKVQGRIAKIADSLRALEENERRMQLEQQRLEIMRMRAVGEVDIPDIDMDTDTNIGISAVTDADMVGDDSKDIKGDGGR